MQDQKILLGKFYAEEEIADMLGISVHKLRKDRWAGKGLKFHKFGNAVRYAEQDVCAYIQACGRYSTTEPCGSR